MLGVSLLFVGITLISNGCLFLQKCDAKSISVMNIITAVVLIGGNFIALANAQTMADYCNAGAGFLFGFTYAIIAANLLLGIDPKASGWYSLMVAIFAVIMGAVAAMDAQWFMVYLWFAWAVLWAATFWENILGKSLGACMCYLCIIEGVFAAFIPAIYMFLLW